MISFAFIITSVKFQFKLISAQIFLNMIPCNELSITLYTLWQYGVGAWGVNSGVRSGRK